MDKLNCLSSICVKKKKFEYTPQISRGVHMKVLAVRERMKFDD